VFDRKTDAVKEGTRRGKAIVERGGLAHVRIKGANGRLESEGTYGKDPRKTNG
jgi:hypothetical protein